MSSSNVLGFKRDDTSGALLVSDAGSVADLVTANAAIAALQAAALKSDLAYQHVATRAGFNAASGSAAATYLVLTAGQWALATGATAGRARFNLEAGLWTPPAGKVLKLLLAVSLQTNNSNSAASFTFNLTPIDAVLGAGGINAVTLGTPIAASAVTFTTPTASQGLYLKGVDFDMPADGDYAITCTESGASSAEIANCCSLYRHWVAA